jgi:SPP1 gp7 family putative phage head morphogenesis protein
MIPKNANTEIYDKTLDRAAMIRLYERRVNGKIELVLNGHVVRTDKLIRDAILSQKGFEAFREAVDQELFKTFKEVYATSKRSLLDLATDQVSFAYQTIENSMGHIWRTERPKMRIAEDLVLKRPIYSDKTLEAGWHSISLGEKKRLENVIRKGMAEGKNVNQIALDVRKGNIHNITMNQSRGLVVTAITSVKSQADQAVYMANEKAIQGWQYVAVLDSRTTPLCAHRDGTIYPVEDTSHLPPAHFHCRSTTVPVFKSWGDMGSLEGVSQVRKRNLAGLSKEQIAFYDGQTPLKESYNDWLLRQPRDVQLRHLGDYKKVELFNSHELSVDKFTNAEGNSIGINELRAMTGVAPMDTKRFASAKQRLDSMRLWATTPDDFINDPKLQKTLKDYYLLQAGELDGTLSLTNYRGNLLHTKAATKRRVLQNSPTEEQLKYNPITGRYDDTRMLTLSRNIGQSYTLN